jgi:hypothetical protein
MNLTQHQAGAILGGGARAFQRYEVGAVVSKPMRISRSCPGALRSGNRGAIKAHSASVVRLHSTARPPHTLGERFQSTCRASILIGKLNGLTAD